MILFLRNQQGKNIVDLEVFTTKLDNNEQLIDVSCTIIIRNYSELLLKSLILQGVNPEQVVNDFEEINEVRGWLHEIYLQNNPEATKQDVIEVLREKLKEVADRYNLKYVED